MSDFSEVEMESTARPRGEDILGKPWIASGEAIARNFKAGERRRVEELNIIGECRAAMARMPTGKRGIVLGSGDKTEQWRKRGWQTLDISPRYRPDVVADANWLERSDLEPYDFIYAECINFDIKGKTGVGRARLLREANQALKTGGRLIIQTAHIEGKQTPLPDRKWYAKLMVAHGFKTIVELHELKGGDEQIKEQRVIYYGEKRAEGWDQSRTEGLE